jgi:PKD repeat protein
MARLKFGITLAVAAALGLVGCTVHKQDTPSLSGPSELGMSVTVTVSPDVLTQDGASQSLVTVTVRDATGQPVRNVPLRAEITVNNIITDFGTLSARNVVTDANGRATVTYTAPAAPPINVDNGTIVGIDVTPSGTNFGNQVAIHTATIRLVPPGVLGPPSTGLSPSFTASTLAPTDQQSVIFDASTSTSTGASVTAYQWNFGDGSTGSGITITHAFNTAGTYVVTLTITDSIGRTNSTSQTLTVSAVTLGLPVFTTSPDSPIVGQDIFFTSTTLIGSNGRPITSYSWDFGDGTPGGGRSTTHSYASVGTFTVLLTITDDQGHRAIASQKITVGNGNPLPDFTFNPSAPRSGQQVIFDASATQAAPGRTIVSYSWSFGNGNSGTGQTVTTTFTTGATPTTYNVLLTVTDSAGKTASITKPITINP